MTARFKTYSFSFDSDLPLDERAKNIEPTERIFELRDSGAVPISGPLSPIPDNDEGAARFYLDRLLGEVVEDDVVPVLDPETPALVPGLLMARLEDTGALGVKTVHFTQVSRSIPIFGTNAVVEIEASSKKLVSFDAQLSNVPDVSHMPEMSAQQCYAQLRNFVDRTLPDQPGRSPKLCFFAY